MSIDINHDIETLLNVGSMAKEFESSDTADEWRSAIRQYLRAERLRVRTVKYDLPEEGEDGKFIVVAAHSRTGEEVKASYFWVVANDLLNSANNSAPAATSTQGSAPGQLDWTREEIILAMDFYVTCGAISGGSIPGQHTIEIARLSTLLKKLSAYPPEVQSEKYRNTHDVYLKLMNLRAVQTGGTHGMNRIGRADAAVWRGVFGHRSDGSAWHRTPSQQPGEPVNQAQHLPRRSDPAGQPCNHASSGESTPRIS